MHMPGLDEGLVLAQDIADLVHTVAQIGEHDHARRPPSVGRGRMRAEMREDHLLQRGHLGVRRRAPHQMIQPRLELPGQQKAQQLSTSTSH